MRWAVFIIMSSFFLGFDEGLSSLFAIHTLGGVAPRIVVVLALFISLFASKHAALWGCWLIGFASDMGPQGESIEAGLFIPGPACIGLTIFCLLVMQIRGSVFRQRPITMVAMTFVGSLLLGFIGMAIVFLRWMAPWIESAAPPDLLVRMGQELGIALYSALLAGPIGACMFKLITIWGFPQSGTASR